MLSVGGTPASFATLEDAITANRTLGDKYVVVQSLSRFKCFGLLLSQRHVLDIPKEMCLLEMVLRDTARPFIDFDTDIRDNIPHIEDAISRYYLHRYKLHVTIRWKWSGPRNIRWHCIVSGVYYNGCWATECIDMVQYLLEEIPHLVVDKGIYKSTLSSLRMVGQCKYVDGRYIRRLVPLDSYDIEDMHVSHTDTDICIRTMHKTPRDITQVPDILGLGDTDPTKKIPYGLTLGKVVLVSEQCVIFRLDRRCSSYCAICNRTHDRENGMLLMRPGSTEIRCFRQISGR